MKTFNQFLAEANQGERHKELQFKRSERELPNYSSTKDISMMKARRRRSDFESGSTHPRFKRTEPWSKPHTHGYSAAMDSQRKLAHRQARNVSKPRAGTTPEDRASEAIWRRHGMPMNPGPMETISKSDVRARKAAVLRQGEQRRSLRTQAVRALGRTMGWNHIDSPNR